MKKITIAIIIVILLFSILAVRFTGIYSKILKQFYPIKYSEYVEKYSKEYDIDPLLIYSIIKTESNFNEKAVSSSNAKGLMQLMDSTAIEISNNLNIMYETNNIFDVEKNILFGIRYYYELLQTYNNNMLLALAAYNAGIGNVNDWIEKGIINEDGSNIENIPFKETNMYVRKIINNYKLYSKLYK